MPESSAAGFLLDDGWKLVKVKPEVVAVHANGTNGNCHHDEATDPQQTLFYRPLWTHRVPSHNSKMVLSTIHVGGPEEARTPRKDRCAKDHRAPNHISKTVPPTVHLGPPNLTKSRTFTLRFRLDF